MDKVKRERAIELGAEIASLRNDIATRQSKLAAAETEFERLFDDARQSHNFPDTNTTNGAGPTPPTLERTELVTRPPALVIPAVIGNMSEQALAVFVANPDRQFSGETMTAALNQMAGRATPVILDSVNAALSRLTTDGSIFRIERGLYKVRPSIIEKQAANRS